MRVQVIYGEHAEADFACRACGGNGAGPAGVITREICWACQGKGSLVADQRTYTYEAPEGTKLWDVLITPTPQQSGKRGTVVRLGSDYDGPCREAYALHTFPCRGCGHRLTPADPRFFCRACWGRTPPELREALDTATGFKAVPIVRAITQYLEIA